MTEKKYTILSLDPMYSSLHWMISQLVAERKYAIVSCAAFCLYLPGFRCYLAHNLTKAYCDDSNDYARYKIKQLNSYYHNYVRKRKDRELDNSELNYMAAFYLSVKDFIQQKKINLVILHNDTRWHHAIVIQLCQELSVPYLVTEQGYHRPYTTMIDQKGCNANSDIALQFNRTTVDDSTLWHPLLPTFFYHHESWFSKLYFSGFLVVHGIEKIISQPLKYRHSTYPLKKYIKRWGLKYKKSMLPIRNQVNEDDFIPQVLVILQLESDSQVLMFSDVVSNQELIEKFEMWCQQHRLTLLIKPHPLDVCDYNYQPSTKVCLQPIEVLIDYVDVAFTINSSAVFELLETDIPMYLFGESIFNQDGIAKKCELMDAELCLSARHWQQDTSRRQAFRTFLQRDYLLFGSGFSFQRQYVQQKLDDLLGSPS